MSIWATSCIGARPIANTKRRALPIDIAIVLSSEVITFRVECGVVGDKDGRIPCEAIGAIAAPPPTYRQPEVHLHTAPIGDGAS